jgi:hypothetical protein
VHSVFHQFGQAKFAYGGLILSSSHFLLMLLLPQNLMLDTEVVKNKHIATSALSNINVFVATFTTFERNIL